ncbi:Glutaminyl-peptide cyclotransferase [Aphelenchoides besseyi]|nr:Glutaminyl-peptide cyclotransferase [Aphelenchoides besseyi]KAI6202570.1 Glutaminyl-peptide cyclotransferase [Aphelenchoides besseyi]
MLCSRYCLLAAVILMLICMGDTLAQWRVSQRPPRMNYNLTIQEATLIAALTNMHTFQQILKPILIPRIVSTPQHRQVGEYLFKKMQDAGFHVEWDQFVDNTPYGSNQFLLACHYDSKILNGSVFIGAVDSAVPCAMLVDFANSLGPLLRSHTNSPVTLQLDAFVLLDLLGAPNPRIAHTIGHGTRPLFVGLENIEKNLRSAGKLRPIPQIFSGHDSWHAVEDDHIPFLESGVPIMHLIPVPFPAVWHTPSDNEKALDNRTIYNLLSILRVFVAEYLGLKPMTFTE